MVLSSEVKEDSGTGSAVCAQLSLSFTCDAEITQSTLSVFFLCKSVDRQINPVACAEMM